MSFSVDKNSQAKQKNFFVFLSVFGLLFFLLLLGYSLRAQNIVYPIEILNLFDGQTISSTTYKFKFEAKNEIEFLELRFIPLGSADAKGRQAYAKRESGSSNIWIFDLETTQLGSGNFRLETVAIYSDQTTVAGQTKNFTIAQNLTFDTKIKIASPVSGQIINEPIYFTAETNIPVAEIVFSIFDSNKILQEQLISSTSTPTLYHQVKFLPSTISRDGKYLLQAEYISPTSTFSSLAVDFYIANSVADINTSTTSIFLVSPVEQATIVGNVLLQAKVSTSVDEVYFRLDSDFIPARRFDQNIWQEYILTNNYSTGTKDLLAIARLGGKEYYSNRVQVKIDNDDSVRPNQDLPKQPGYIITPPLVDNINTNSLNSTTTVNILDESTSTSPIEPTNLSESEQRLIECQNQDIKNISCGVYLKNKDSFTTECINKVLNVDECLAGFSKCQVDGIVDIDLCQKYLTEPRAARWCDLVEFKDQPLCQNYLLEKRTSGLIRPEVDLICLQQSIFDSQACQRFKEYISLSAECQQAGFKRLADCRQFLQANILPAACRLIGQSDLTLCQQNILQKYQTGGYCQDENCREDLKKFIGELSAREISLHILKEVQQKKTNGFLTNDDLGWSPVQALQSRLAVSLQPNFSYQLLPADDQIKISQGFISQPLPAMVVKDSDQDGLPDDMERRIGSDLTSSDTDDDGYNDLTEVLNGYDPLLAGAKWSRLLSAVEKAIINRQTFQHPVVGGQETDELQIESITNSPAEVNANLLLRGTGPAYGVLSLYFYSDLPLLATVQVDEYGRWQYDLLDSLTDGSHQVYLVINDETGKVQKKSTPQVFFINQAKAAAVGEFIDLTVSEETTALEKYYIWGATVPILLALGLFLFLRRRHKDEIQLS